MSRPRRRRHRQFSIGTRVYQVGRGLTRTAALRKALQLDKRAGYGDYRGASYDPSTGRAALT